MAELQSIIVFHGRHFVRYLEIWLSDLCQTYTTRYYAQFSEKKWSLYINK